MPQNRQNNPERRINLENLHLLISKFNIMPESKCVTAIRVQI